MDCDAKVVGGELETISGGTEELNVPGIRCLWDSNWDLDRTLQLQIKQ